MNPLVSILINNYNYGEFVGQAIESCLAQTYDEIEIIVVDDGSTDNSPAAIASFGNRIRPVFKKNGGQASAYNAGWDICQGKLILFLDSDDVLLPDAIEKSVRKILETKALKVHFLLQKVNKSLEPIPGFMPTYGLGDIKNITRDIVSWGYYLCPPSSGNLFSREFSEKVMPAPESEYSDRFYRLPPDGYLSGLAGLFGNIAAIDEPLGLYRVHGNNMSDAGAVDTREKLHKLFMIDYLREKSQETWAKKIGFPYRFDRSRFHPTVCKQRFLSYRLDKSTHPIADDSYFFLLLSGLWGALQFPYLSMKKRIFIFIGFIAIGIMPHRFLNELINSVAKPDQRKGVLRFFRFGN